MTTIAPAFPAMATAVRPDYAGITVAEAPASLRGRPVMGSSWAFAGAAYVTDHRGYGSHLGYASLEDAIAALQYSTRSTGPRSGAAAIVEQDGRFFGVGVHWLGAWDRPGGDERVVGSRFTLQNRTGGWNGRRLHLGAVGPDRAATCVIRAVVDGSVVRIAPQSGSSVS